MALVNLKCFRAYISRAQTYRCLLTGQALNHFSQEIRQLRLCNSGSAALPTVCSVTGFQREIYQSYHTELGNPPNSMIGTVQLHGEAGNSFKSACKWTEDQLFSKELENFHSYKDIFKFLSSLECLSDTMVAATFQRVCDVETQDGRLRNAEKVVEDERFTSLCFHLEQESPHLSDSGLVTLLNALIKLRMDPWSPLIVRLVSESQGRLDKGQMTIQNLCILGEALYDLEGPNCTMLEQVMDLVRSSTLENWRSEEIAMVYKLLQLGIGETGKYQHLLNRMNSLTLSKVSQFSSKLTSMVLNALVVLDQTEAVPLVIKLCNHSTRHIPRFTDEEMIKVLEAFIHFGHNSQFFIDALERCVAQSAFTMHPAAVSKVMQYCSRKQILAKPIFSAVSESFVYNADKFSTAQIADQIVPFGQLNYLPPNAPSLFQKLERVLGSRFGQFQPHVLLNLLHSFTLVERYPLNFLAKVFSPYFLQQLQADEPGLERSVRSQLTQLYLTVTLECPSYEGPRLLPKYRVKSFLSPGPSQLESLVDVHLYNRVKAGLIDLLGARIYFESHVLTPYCYTLDIEIKLDEGGFVLPANQREDVCQRIALCIDDPKRFCTKGHTLLGREAIKQRHLQLVGYDVVQIPFFEFELLDTRHDIVEYLHKKIFPNSYRLSW